MKKNRGVTILEILISILIISIVLVLLYALLNQVRDDDNKSSVNSNYIINEESFIKLIEEDFIDYEISAIYSCDLSEFNIDQSTFNKNAGYKCVKFQYSSSYIKDNIAYLAIYNYYTKYGDVCGKGIQACDAKWVVRYDRGYYEDSNDYTTWKSVQKVMHDYKDDIVVDNVPYVNFTATSDASVYSAAELVIPIENKEAEHYDINVGFLFKGTNLKCDNRYSNKLSCNCKYGGSVCNNVLLENDDELVEVENSKLTQEEIKITLNDVENFEIPDFSPNKLEYNITVDNNVTKFKIEKVENTDSKKKIDIQGGDELKGGDNVKYITVTAEDGNVTVYTIHIYRQIDTTYTLENISVQDYNDSSKEYLENFNPNTNSYTVKVPYSTSKIKLTCKAKSSLSIVDGCSDGTVSLNVGKNDKTITVRSESGDTNRYYLYIVRSGNGNTKLETINVSSGILMKKEENGDYEYILQIDKSIDSVILEGIPAASTSTVESGNGTYTGDLNNKEIIFEVKAQDGTTAETKLTIQVVDDDSSKQSSTVTTSVGKLSKVSENEYTLVLPSSASEVILTGPFGEALFKVDSNTYGLTLSDGTDTYYFKVKRS